MICSDCGIKNGKSQFCVSTFNKMICDWCNEEKYCVSEYKYGLPEKPTPTLNKSEAVK